MSVSFTITRNGAASGPLTVSYATSSGSATSNSDFVQSSGSLTFLPSETSKTILVRTLADASTETEESFDLTISSTQATVNPPHAAGPNNSELQPRAAAGAPTRIHESSPS
jgi:hypothetical protein